MAKSKNRFNVLRNEPVNKSAVNCDKQSDVDAMKTELKPPPIFIQGVTSYAEMLENLVKIVERDTFIIKSLANDIVKINVDTADNFRKLVKGLKYEKIAFSIHTNSSLNALIKLLPGICIIL